MLPIPTNPFSRASISHFQKNVENMSMQECSHLKNIYSYLISINFLIIWSGYQKNRSAIILFPKKRVTWILASMMYP